MIWQDISTVPEFQTVLLGARSHLYPVLGFKMGAVFLLEEGGSEEDERRQYPMLWWTPTHWAPAPESP